MCSISRIWRTQYESSGKYRKELIGRISLFVTLICLAMLFIVMGNGYLKDRLQLAQDYVDAVSGFFVGFEPVCMFVLGYFISALRDEKRLKRMYIEEHDERTAAILAKAGCSLIGILSMILFAFAILAGYFSLSAGLTLAAVALTQDLIMFGLLIFWNHRL